ncbi:MAG: hypothetical protein P4L85_15785 [Paludisphaera borealis]|uniref:PEP-CTERM sorting domain-containing protein n=1 Tax=Paludisphaera borealis TaxID=1387353 RepID=UPI00284050E3|nr:PEP-CTERM sorting domain-containing protein [Paludisphaera borealis]MDR3620812.1 hypothetical protein [Paludisphaera borealis]
MLILAAAGPSRGGVVYSGFLAGRHPGPTITSAGDYSNPSTLFPFSGVNTTSASLSQTGDWSFHLSTRSEVQNTTISAGELQEASATIQVDRIGYLSGPGPFPTTLLITGVLGGEVVVGVNSFHDGYLSFGSSSIGSLEDLFFTDQGTYDFPNRALSMIVPVNADGSYLLSFALHSESWGRVGVTSGDFGYTLKVTSILLVNGLTPESQGFTMSFDDGSGSPNAAAPAVPEPSGLVLLGVAFACVAGKYGRRNR